MTQGSGRIGEENLARHCNKYFYQNLFAFIELFFE